MAEDKKRQNDKCVWQSFREVIKFMIKDICEGINND